MTQKSPVIAGHIEKQYAGISFGVNTLFDVLIDTRAVRMFTVANKQREQGVKACQVWQPPAGGLATSRSSLVPASTNQRSNHHDTVNRSN